ncbi:MAG: glycosyltransferase [Gammaproteobacteria bacterium]|nr:glycosyltransferase [Gammaproteobacteria bacterium]MDE0225706.1 glycosyltransferase [Gammaproteobacteria bacterium]MDE0452247.1 glycosyltransferase [Gammaproteobacteria bacterium]
MSQEVARHRRSVGGHVGIIITAVDETWSLRQTVDTLLSENSEAIAEIMIGIASHTTPGCRAVVAALEAAYPDRVRHHEQSRLSGAGGANRECIPLMRSPWLLIMAADLETHPGTVVSMISRAGMGDVDIVSTSRWLGGGRFGNYSPVKRVCNWLFQRFFSVLYRAHLTDMTFGFRLYRARELSRYEWHETGHAFFFEALVKPLRCGARVAEIATHWQGRREGTTHMRTSGYLGYFRIGLLTRVQPVRGLLVPRGNASCTR